MLEKYHFKWFLDIEQYYYSCFCIDFSTMTGIKTNWTLCIDFYVNFKREHIYKVSFVHFFSII